MPYGMYYILRSLTLIALPAEVRCYMFAQRVANHVAQIVVILDTTKSA